jgi:SAM-dependent MidA family methyltransferase
VDRLTADLRRVAPTDLADVGEDAALVARIRDEIRRDGPMSFARFMDLVLYDPDGGYYRSAEARPGRAGDFLTAPELHPIFGETLAGGLAELWTRLGRPSPFRIREHGAGTGTLAVSVLGAIDPAFRAAIRYQPVEVDPRRASAFVRAVRDAGYGEVLRTGAPEPTSGIALANEVLDALPVHRVRRRGDRLVELAVGLGAADAFVEVEIEPTTDALAGRLATEGIELVDGQTAEICLALDDWVAGAIAGLERVVLLLIDYGAPAAELYDPVRRRDGTLRAYVRHRVHDDPFRFVGRQDLTAHVDTTAVEAAAHRAGLATIGLTTQAEALVGLGIEARLQAVQADPATDVETYTALRASLLRLLDPAAMGRFRVLAFARGWAPDPADPPLGLFAFRLPPRR